MVLGLQVKDQSTGRNLSFVKGGFRDLIGRLISSIFLCVGYLFIVFRKDKRAAHDLIFETQVVKSK